MMGWTPSPEMIERPRRTIEAMRLLQTHAAEIADHCARATPDQTIAAVVAPDLTVRGVWAVPTANASARLAAADDGGWTLTFAPRTPIEAIKQQCQTVAATAAKRAAALQRRLDR